MSRHPVAPPVRDWRDYLTPEEQRVVGEAELALDEWRRLKPIRARIANEAAQRARAALPVPPLSEEA